jgi:hypothetical protein
VGSGKCYEEAWWIMDKQLLIDLSKNAQEIISYYKEFSNGMGVVGAGEFMGMAASWNMEVPRPSERKIIKDK